MLLRLVCITCSWLLIVDGVHGKIVFSSSRPRLAFKDPSGSNIFLMNSDGRDLTRLTHDGGIESYPAWSPDGHHIAYERAFRGWAIWVMNADGTDRQNLTSHVPADARDPLWDYTPSWHPDGDRIAFQRFIWETEETHIYVISIDDGHIKKLISNAFTPRFSPDGKWIGFLSNNNQLWVANADGTNPRQLSDEEDVELGGWSPDSRQILYRQLGGPLDPQILFILTVNPVFDDKKAVPNKEIRMPIWFTDPTFGADGKSILFSGHGGGKRWHIYRMYLEDERVIQLTFGEFIDYYPHEWKIPLPVSPRGKVPLLWGEIKEK